MAFARELKQQVGARVVTRWQTTRHGFPIPGPQVARASIGGADQDGRDGAFTVRTCDAIHYAPFGVFQV
jgi:hypothetical protein